jgi:CDP-6-deoxy-D-xylo-4-hexulose-3-dehydrase
MMDGEITHRSIPLAGCTFTEAEVEAVSDVMRSGRLTMGEKCRQLEEAFAIYTGRHHAIFVNSGSSANLLACFAAANPDASFMGLPNIKGREVIVPALTWSTTIFPIAQAGALPVLVDCDPVTLQARDDLIAAAVNPNTAGVCLVHVLGGAAPDLRTMKLCEDHNLWLIEDTCESLGVRCDGRMMGTLGQMATFSFYFSHQMTTIEGGMVVCDDDRLADLLRAMRSNGWTRDMRNGRAYEEKRPDIDSRFLFQTMGFNLRPTEISGALGLIQLGKLETMNRRRRDIFDRISDASIRAGLFPMRFPPWVTPAPFGVPIMAASKSQRATLRTYLESHGIDTRPIIAGNIACHPCMETIEHRVHGSLATSDRIMDCGLYVGAFPTMSEEDVAHVVTALERF